MDAARYDFMEGSKLSVGFIFGTGNKAFCSSADVNQWLPFKKSTADRSWKVPDLPCKTFATKALIAKVNGIVLGGGGEIAMIYDLRIASENATFRWSEPNSCPVCLIMFVRWKAC